MTVITAPNVIEHSDFSEGGYASVPDSTGMPPNTLRDVLNLLPDEGGSEALVVRDGFLRLREELTGDAGRYVVSLQKARVDGSVYIIAVTTTGTSGSGNVEIYAIDLSDNSITLINSTPADWTNPEKPHVLLTIDETLFGSSQGNDWYSWDGTTFDDDAAVNTNWKTLVDDTNAGVNTDTEYGRDFAFTGKEHVLYNGDVFVPAKGIRFDKWDDDEQHYSKGERVSHWAAWGHTGTPKYWKSFRCIEGHNPDAVDAEPGVGADWRDYWEKIRLPLAQDDDGETSEKWYFQPIPQGTDVAAFWADRMFARGDHVAGKNRLLFSAPMRMEKGEDVPDVEFNMHDWAPGNDRRGPGGGWIPFDDGRHSGIIEAIHPYGQYLLVFKRQAVWALSGRSEETFTPRRLAHGVGCVGPQAVAELDGIVYFLSDDGLYVTDGTTVEPALNYDYVAHELEARRDDMAADATALEPQLQAWHDRIWLSMPIDGTSDFVTYVYDPRYGTWWKTNLPISCSTVQRYQGVPQFYFAAPPNYGLDLVYVYGDDTQDDDGGATNTPVDIDWSMTTAWWPFGTLRQQRRLRRSWALVKAAESNDAVTFNAYRNWDGGSQVMDVTRTLLTDQPQHIEGAWFADSHAVSYHLEATTESGAAVYGVAVETEPRRNRYHTG